MIQFNLLPDVKLEYIKAKRLKRTMIAFSTLAAAASLVIAVLLFLGVNVVQKKHMNDLTKDLSRSAKTLQDTPNINTMLTVQNQLKGLTALHTAKPAATRVFDYLAQVTPSDVSASSVLVDYLTNSLTISGSGKDLLAVNTFVDTLKFTSFKSDKDDTKSSAAFSKVTLSSFGASEKSAAYQITLTFDPALFDNQQKITLVVPQTITTRSQIDKPTELFQQPVKEEAK